MRERWELKLVQYFKPLWFKDIIPVSRYRHLRRQLQQETREKSGQKWWDGSQRCWEESGASTLMWPWPIGSSVALLFCMIRWYCVCVSSPTMSGEHWRTYCPCLSPVPSTEPRSLGPSPLGHYHRVLLRVHIHQDLFTWPSRHLAEV